jgi:hypothetical protein
MNLDQIFFDNLNKLVKHKTNPDLTDFFETIYKLEKLSEGFDDMDHKKSPETLKLEKQAQVLTKKLATHKDEIARRTKTQKEYDAVYSCINYLDVLFNHQK